MKLNHARLLMVAQTCLVIGLMMASNTVIAQQILEIRLPNIYIKADSLQRGDGDTYGIGDWHCNVTARVEGTEVVLDGTISFTEKANDFTTITGHFSRRFVISALKQQRYCSCALQETTGKVAGPNIGARGYRWFEGEGLVRRARIQTDTFGDDTGRVGGMLEMNVIKLAIACQYAMKD